MAKADVTSEPVGSNKGDSLRNRRVKHVPQELFCGPQPEG